MDNKSLGKFVKLPMWTDQPFKQWFADLVDFLAVRGLAKYILEDQFAADDDSTYSFEEKQIGIQIFIIIKEAIGPSRLYAMGNTRNYWCFEAMENLRKEFSHADIHEADIQRQKWNNVRWKQGEKPQEFLERLHKMNRSLQYADAGVTAPEFALQFLRQLPEKYRSVYDQFRFKTFESLTELKEIVRLCRIVDGQEDSKNTQKSKLMHTMERDNWRKRNLQQGHSGKPSYGLKPNQFHKHRSNIVCGFCKKTGHIKAECRLRARLLAHNPQQNSEWKPKHPGRPHPAPPRGQPINKGLPSFRSDRSKEYDQDKLFYQQGSSSSGRSSPAEHDEEEQNHGDGLTLRDAQRLCAMLDHDDDKTFEEDKEPFDFEDLSLERGYNDYMPSMYALTTNEPTGNSSFLVDTGTTSLFTGDKTIVDSPLEISPIKVNVGKNDSHFLATHKGTVTLEPVKEPFAKKTFEILYSKDCAVNALPLSIFTPRKGTIDVDGVMLTSSLQTFP